MKRSKYFLAVFFGKLSAIGLKILKRNIPYYPGYVALKICPDFLKMVKKPKLIIAVTGTNGKSTICSLLKDSLENLGLKVINNNGFNIDTGIAAMFLKQKKNSDVAILEVDEKTSGEIFESVVPNYLLCTNLFRDSMKTNSSIDYVLSLIQKGIPKETKLILNADDLFTVELGLGRENIYFGMEEQSGKEDSRHRFCDLIYCPKCGAELQFLDRKYYHIGNVKCPKCGLTNPKRDYNATIDEQKKILKINDHEFPLKVTSIFNIYNYIAVISLLLELGFKASEIQKVVENSKITDSRFHETKLKNLTIINHMAKGQNPVACSSVLKYVKEEPGSKCVLLMLDDVTDNRYSSETIAWYYDTDFDCLNDSSIKEVIIGGKRSKDLYVALLLANVSKEKIVRVDNEYDMPSKINFQNITKIFLLHDITSYEQSMVIEEKIKREFSK